EGGPGLVASRQFPTPPVERHRVEALGPAERPDGQTTTLPTGDDSPPVQLAARLPVYGFGHGSPPFGHAAIVTWAARRGSPDAHVDPPVPLLHAVWVPRDLVVDELRAVVLEVETLRRGVGRQQDADGALVGRGLERRLDGFPALGIHAAVHRHHPVLPGE